MKLLRLQVQVLPWQDTASANWAPLQRKEVILPWTEPCPENLTISELAERIETRFENIHKGKGKLKIKWLEDGYCGILDGNDTVIECFADRTGGMAHVKDFTVRVARFPPDPQELQNPARFASIAPESTARPRKRHRNHLLEQATPGGQEYHQELGACGVTNKRQRIGGRSLEGIIDPDRPVLSSERDSYELHEESGRTDKRTSAYIIADSQPSPPKDQYNSYRTPQSLSVSSPHGLLASSQTELVTITKSPPHRDILLTGNTKELARSSIDTQPKSESPDSQNPCYSVPYANTATPVAGQHPVDPPVLIPFVKSSLPPSVIEISRRPASHTIHPWNTGAAHSRTPERHLQASTVVAVSEGRLTRSNSPTKTHCPGQSHGKLAQGRQSARDIYEPTESDLESSQCLPRLLGTEGAKTKHSSNLKHRPFSRIHTISNDSESQTYTIPDATEVLFDWPRSTVYPSAAPTVVASDTGMQQKRPYLAENIQCQPQQADPTALNAGVHRASDKLAEPATVAPKKFEHRRYGLQNIDKGEVTSPLEPREGHSSDRRIHIDQEQHQDSEMEQRSKLSTTFVRSDNGQHICEQTRKVGGPEWGERVKDGKAQRTVGVEYTEETQNNAPTPISKKAAGSLGTTIRVRNALNKESEKVGKARAAVKKKALQESEQKKTSIQRARESNHELADQKVTAALAEDCKKIEEMQRSESRESAHRGLGSEDPYRSIVPRSSGSKGGNLVSLINREPEFPQDSPCRGASLDVQMPLPSTYRATSRRSVSFVEQAIENPHAICREALDTVNGIAKNQYDASSSSIDVEMNQVSVATSKKLAQPAKAVVQSRDSSKRPTTSEEKQSKIRIIKPIEKGNARAYDQPSPPEPFKSDRSTSSATSASHEPTTKQERGISSAVSVSKIQDIVGGRPQSKSPSRSPAREVISSASSNSESKEASPTFRKSITASGISSSEDEAEQQLQREARQSTKPSHIPEIIASKVSDSFRTSAHAGGQVNKVSLNGARLAYGRFPSLSGLKSNTTTGMPNQPSVRKLPGFVAPIERVQPHFSNSTQADGSRISDGSSSESSSGSNSSDEDSVETSRALGASGSLSKQTLQGKSAKGLHGILKSTSNILPRKKSDY